MKIKQFHIHGGPIGKLCSGSMLTERLIISEPHSSRKMVVCAQDQKLVLHQILPAVRKVANQDEGKNSKHLHPPRHVFYVPALFLQLGGQHKLAIQ